MTVHGGNVSRDVWTGISAMLVGVGLLGVTAALLSGHDRLFRFLYEETAVEWRAKDVIDVRPDKKMPYEDVRGLACLVLGVAGLMLLGGGFTQLL